jgi:hypothetical protein
MDNVKFSYKDKINAISSYFGVSEDASKYMYHRRRRGYPYKKDTDLAFLKWTTKLQNAFIKADQIATFDWNNLKFDEDLTMLCIDVETQANKVQVNKISQTVQPTTRQSNVDEKSVNDESDDGGGWTVVTTNKGQLVKRHMLRKMGFLPHPNPVYTRDDKKKYYDKKFSTEKTS